MTGSIDGAPDLNDDASPEFCQEHGTRFAKCHYTANRVFPGTHGKKKWEGKGESGYPCKNGQSVVAVKHGTVGEARTKVPTAPFQDLSSWKWKPVSIQTNASLVLSSVYGRLMDGVR
jgi:hypothetical protein